MLLWLVGVFVMMLRQVQAQRAYKRNLGPLTVDGEVAISRSLSVGPSLVGIWRPVTYEFKLSFSSSSQMELSCVADVFAAHGKPELVEAMRSSWNGKRHEASFKTIAETVPPEADELVASLSKCHLGVDSKLTWSVDRRAT